MNRTAVEIVLFLAIVAGFFYSGAQFHSEFAQRDLNAARATQAGCERTNAGVRRPLYDFITDAMHTRREQARVTTGEERVANALAADRYAHRRAAMVNAVEDVAKAPGSPEVACQDAFPLP